MTTKPAPPTDPDTGELLIRPFADWLREQASGASHDELSDALHTLVDAVQDTGRQGTLAYIITVKPTEEHGPLVLTDEIKLRVPEHKRKGSFFYVDDNGNLTRKDPNQLEFEGLREVPQSPVRDDADGTAQAKGQHA